MYASILKNLLRIVFIHPLNPVAPPPTQASPFRSIAPTARILNSPFIHTNTYLELSSDLGLDVTAVMTQTSEL
uniref:Secreted protein n=1 Tax=Mesocestoides corti TaxID=53468 RepID=A0A5K3F2H8_MESCO